MRVGNMKKKEAQIWHDNGKSVFETLILKLKKVECRFYR